jgi:hypothetical protein
VKLKPSKSLHVNLCLPVSLVLLTHIGECSVELIVSQFQILNSSCNSDQILRWQLMLHFEGLLYCWLDAMCQPSLLINISGTKSHSWQLLFLLLKLFMALGVELFLSASTHNNQTNCTRNLMLMLVAVAARPMYIFSCIFMQIQNSSNEKIVHQGCAYGRYFRKSGRWDRHVPASLFP